MKKIVFLFSVFLFTQAVFAQKVNNFAPDFSSPPVIPGMTLHWNDEFNTDGKPDPASWRMDWDNESIKLFLDDQLLNEVSLSETFNPDGFNPFLQPHYLLLNLAIGANGGYPGRAQFPVKYEIDYVRIYQKK
jgi:hypothetical protein